MSTIITQKDILAVIVLYNSKFENCNTCKTLLSQEQDLSVFIYDNSPVGQHQASDFDNSTHYVSDPTNPGLSFAYNKAYQYAKDHNFKWLLLLDQDTIFAPKIISSYLEAINHNNDCKMVVAPMQVMGGKFMSPVKKRFLGCQLQKTIPFERCDSKKYCAINSGMMINVTAFESVGGYNEKVFLDFSDYEFLERFSRHFANFFVIRNICQQEFSNQLQTKEQKLNRFKLFCKSVKHCNSYSFLHKISYICVVVKRTVSLSISTKSLVPFKIFIQNYI